MSDGNENQSLTATGSGKSEAEIAFELLNKLKGQGVWGERNLVAILDMYAECLDAAKGLRAYPGQTRIEAPIVQAAAKAPVPQAQVPQAQAQASHAQPAAAPTQQAAPQAPAQPATPPRAAQPVQPQAQPQAVQPQPAQFAPPAPQPVLQAPHDILLPQAKMNS